MLSPQMFPPFDVGDRNNIMAHLDHLITKAENKEHLSDPGNFFKEMTQIYIKMMGNHKGEMFKTLYQVLKNISQHTYKKASSSSNLILKDIFDTIYNDRQVDFTRYDYVNDVSLNTQLVDFDLKINIMSHQAQGELDLVRLLRKIGVKETLLVLKLLAAKVCVAYSNLSITNTRNERQ